MARTWIERRSTFEGSPAEWLIDRWPALLAASGGWPERAELLAAVALADHIPGPVVEWNHNPAFLRCPVQSGVCVRGWFFSSFSAPSVGLDALRVAIESSSRAGLLWRQGRWEFWREMVAKRRLPRLNRSLALRAFLRALEFVRAHRPGVERAAGEVSAGQIHGPAEEEWLNLDARARLRWLQGYGLELYIFKRVSELLRRLPRRYRTAAMQSRASQWHWAELVSRPWGSLFEFAVATGRGEVGGNLLRYIGEEDKTILVRGLAANRCLDFLRAMRVPVRYARACAP